jgi:hypothetical protein
MWRGETVPVAACGGGSFGVLTTTLQAQWRFGRGWPITPVPTKNKRATGYRYPRAPLGRNHYLPVSTNDAKTSLVLLASVGILAS